MISIAVFRSFFIFTKNKFQLHLDLRLKTLCWQSMNMIRLITCPPRSLIDPRCYGALEYEKYFFFHKLKLLKLALLRSCATRNRSCRLLSLIFSDSVSESDIRRIPSLDLKRPSKVALLFLNLWKLLTLTVLPLNLGSLDSFRKFHTTQEMTIEKSYSHRVCQ